MADATDLSCFVVMPSEPGTDVHERTIASLTSMTELKSKPSEFPSRHEEIFEELNFYKFLIKFFDNFYILMELITRGC